MADDNTEPDSQPVLDDAPDPSVTDEPDSEPGDDIEKMRAALKKANEEAKNYRLKAKELEPLAAKAKELEDAKKTEEQRLQDRIAELEPSAKEAAKLRVALRKGLTEVQARRLVGDTEEDLEKDADELLESFAPAEGGPAAPARRPKERLKPGAANDSEPEETDPRKLAARLPRF